MSLMQSDQRREGSVIHHHALNLRKVQECPSNKFCVTFQVGEKQCEPQDWNQMQRISGSVMAPSSKIGAKLCEKIA
jgi:hypothetical protein